MHRKADAGAVLWALPKRLRARRARVDEHFVTGLPDRTRTDSTYVQHAVLVRFEHLYLTRHRLQTNLDFLPLKFVCLIL